MSERNPETVKAEIENEVKRQYAIVRRFAPPNTWDGERARKIAEKEMNKYLDIHPYGVDRSLGDTAVMSAFQDTIEMDIVTPEMLEQHRRDML